MHADPLSVEAVFLDAGNTILGMDYDFLSAVVEDFGHKALPAALHRAEAAARVRLDEHLAGGNSTETQDTFALYCDLVLDGIGFPKGTIRQRLRERAFTPEHLDRLWSKPMPGAAEALAAMAETGIRLAVVSNADGRVHERLRNAGLTRHLEYVADSHVVGVEKPDPRIFAHTLERLGAAKDRVLHVGDYHAIDVIGAQRAGITGILLDPFGFWGDRGCARIRDVPELAAWLTAAKG